MLKGKMKTLLSAAVLSMLGVSLLVGGTYALFSSKVSVTNHLKAGNLNISLVRTSYSKLVLDTDGFLEEKTDSTETDFTTANDKNIFGLEANELIVPTSKFSANLKLINGKKVDGSYVKSSVAFTYTVKLIKDDESNSDLLDQLEVTVTKDATTVTKKLSECEDLEVFSGVMTTSDEYSAFTVALEFLNLADSENNKVQEKEANFDLVIEAVQKTSRE